MRSFLLLPFFLTFVTHSDPRTGIQATTTSSAPVNTIRGVVIKTGTEKPVANVLVYVIEGEEESLTNAKGEFSIQTRHAFPVALTAQELAGKKTKVRVMAKTGDVKIQMP